MATVQENFKALRKKKRITQKQIYQQLGYEDVSGVAVMESRTGLPKPETIVRMAKVIGCSPAELLKDVRTDYDKLRDGDYASETLDTKLARIKADALSETEQRRRKRRMR